MLSGKVECFKYKIVKERLKPSVLFACVFSLVSLSTEMQMTKGRMPHQDRSLMALSYCKYMYIATSFSSQQTSEHV